jgi:hypothetical protein
MPAGETVALNPPSFISICQTSYPDPLPTVPSLMMYATVSYNEPIWDLLIQFICKLEYRFILQSTVCNLWQKYEREHPFDHLAKLFTRQILFFPMEFLCFLTQLVYLYKIHKQYAWLVTYTVFLFTFRQNNWRNLTGNIHFEFVSTTLFIFILESSYFYSCDVNIEVTIVTFLSLVKKKLYHPLIYGLKDLKY